MRATKFVIIFLMATTAWCCRGQKLNINDEILKWETTICAGLNNDGYEVDWGIMYFPNQFLGISFKLGGAGEIKEIGDWGVDDYESGHHYISRLKLNPAIVLRTPRIINWKNKGAGFYLFTEPGYIISPGARGSKNARIACWDLRSGINIQVDEFLVYIGYGVSNFSLYSGHPHSYRGYDNNGDNYITHSVFIGISYKF